VSAPEKGRKNITVGVKPRVRDKEEEEGKIKAVRRTHI